MGTLAIEKSLLPAHGVLPTRERACLYSERSTTDDRGPHANHCEHVRVLHPVYGIHAFERRTLLSNFDLKCAKSKADNCAEGVTSCAFSDFSLARSATVVTLSLVTLCAGSSVRSLESTEGLECSASRVPTP